MRNIDRIKNMRLKDIADLLLSIGGGAACECCVHQNTLPEICEQCFKCREGVEQWLFSEAE